MDTTPLLFMAPRWELKAVKRRTKQGSSSILIWVKTKMRSCVRDRIVNNLRCSVRKRTWDFAWKLIMNGEGISIALSYGQLTILEQFSQINIFSIMFNTNNTIKKFHSLMLSLRSTLSFFLSFQPQRTLYRFNESLRSLGFFTLIRSHTQLERLSIFTPPTPPDPRN